MGQKLHTKQGKKSRIGDQDISRCTSKNAASKREENVVNSGSVERKKKKKRKHDSGGIGIDVENKRNGRKKRKVEQYIDQEKELDKPLEKDKKSRPEKGFYAFHLTSDDSNGRVTRKKYNKKDPSACGDDYDIPSESEGLKSKKRKKEHKHNLADDDTEAGLGEGGAIMEVPPKKKDYSKQGEVGNDGYGDSKKEKRSNINKQEKKKHKKKECSKRHEVEISQLDLVYGESTNAEKIINKQGKKTEQNMNKKGDNEVESTDKLAIKSARKVRFSDTVEYFPSFDGRSEGNAEEKDQLVRGKRFSAEEDELIKESIFKYIKDHGLGENGLRMVLHCAKYPEIRKTCWKDVGAALPWRPYKSVFHRAHVLFGRSETRSWTKEEEEIISKYHKKHGSDWRTLGDVMGKHRVQVKDSGRIKLPNMKKGHWSQDEDHTGENINWDAVSQKLSTRTNMNCCLKWYNQLASPMVKGQWEDADDYRLLNSLVGLDACSMEEVDWDCLIENRSGELCRKRWTQMVKQMSEHGKKSFVEQVDIISERYCPNLVDVNPHLGACSFIGLCLHNICLFDDSWQFPIAEGCINF